MYLLWGLHAVGACVPRMRAAPPLLHACTFLRVFTVYGCRAGIRIGDLHVALPVIDEQKRRESGCENCESKGRKKKERIRFEER